MGRYIALLVIVLSFAASIAAPAPGFLSGSGAPPEGAGSARDWVSTDGLKWTDVLQLTSDPAADTHPQLAVSADGITAIAWSRSGDFTWMRVDRNGKTLLAPGIAATGRYPVQHCGFVSPCIGVDSKGCYHICYKIDDFGVYYSKLDGNGNTLVKGKIVPKGAVAEHAPSLAVSRNDIAHISYEDCRYGYEYEAMMYARVLNDGMIDKDGVRISPPRETVSGTNICSDYANNLHATYFSYLVGVFHVKLDNFGNPLPQVPPSLLYKPGGSFESIGPPSICCDPTGGVHVAWNANSSGVGQIMYMKLDNNGNKLASGPDGTGVPITPGDTALGYPALASDKHGRTYVFWSDVREGDPQIWYSTIVSGQENDTLLPDHNTRLTSGNGTAATEPAVGTDADGHLHVAWRQDAGGNAEIFYTLGFNRGVELEMSRDEMDKLMYVHPNETRWANMTLRNDGGLEDNVTVDITCDLHGHKGWKVELSGTRIELKPQETIMLRVSVTGAPWGIANDYIDTRVTARSEGNPAVNDSVAIRTYLVVDERFSLSCPDREHVTPRGVPTSYSITVRNTGDIATSIGVSTSGPPGWNWTAGPEILDLIPGAGATVTLDVTPPAMALSGETGLVTVTFRNMRNPSVHNSVATLTRVENWYNLWLEPDRAESSVLPGGTAVFMVTVNGEGFPPESLPVVLEVSHDGPGWYVWLDSEVAPLRGDESHYSVLRATAPPDAGAGSRVDIQVRAALEDIVASCNMTVSVGAIRSLALSVSPATVSLLPGGTAGFCLDIRNGGNAPDEVRPGGIRVPEGWGVSFSTAGGKALVGNWTVPVEGGETVSVFVALASPEGLPLGRFVSTGWLGCGNGTRLDFELVAETLRFRSLETFCASPEARCSPGETARFPLTFINRGNDVERLALACRGQPDGWPAPTVFDESGIPVQLVSVPAFSVANLTVVAGVPAHTTADDATLEVSAGGEDGLREVVALSLAVDKPDLVISAVTPSDESPRPGELVWVNVTVQNIGPGRARDVVLHCYRNGEAFIVRELWDLGPGESRLETFVWIPRPGRNTLVFIVDPEDRVCESDEAGNTAVMTRYVGAGPRAPPPGTWWLPPAAAGACLAAALGAGLLWRRRRRGPSTLSVRE